MYAPEKHQISERTVLSGYNLEITKIALLSSQCGTAYNNSEINEPTLSRGHKTATGFILLKIAQWTLEVTAVTAQWLRDDSLFFGLSRSRRQFLGGVVKFFQRSQWFPDQVVI